ncbi:hypothetical protein WOLCODRAFT_21798 [Wolfiporia cocos MD-104 SS10]|uniref:Protein BNI4 n=1 Tax=Wolfiporia cocos (strain MD-104) TaxID=742152 RepID=A0A2H3IT52_WOLCO|nr:hypothetical protein WOLCODRAFT_21798 [Wolfiporia cocos MD-104 SS10]
MDALPSQTTTINPSVPRQRSSPANDQSPSPSPMAPQQPYPYPVQQQQAGWSAPHAPQQFYPTFYQNQPYPMYPHGPHAHGPPNGTPWFDPANHQVAQWTYQQMMYVAQQQAQQQQLPLMAARSRSSSGANASDYFVGQAPGFNTFPSGTPPAHPSQLPANGAYSPSDHAQYQGFHPYRRPPRSGASASSQEGTQPAQPQGSDWRAGPQMGSFQPPYARSDAAGSSTSVNSGGSSHGGSHHGGNSTPRQRTSSIQGGSGSSAPQPKPGPGSSSGRSGGAPPPSSNGAQRQQHGRTSSTSSNPSSATRAAPSSSSSSSAASGSPAHLRKPSPLSQGNFTATEKRMSRDDSDLVAMLEPNPNTPGVRSGGLKGRLRRALSLGANATLQEEDEDEDSGKGSAHTVPAASSPADDAESTATVQKKKSRSLFNSRLNRSTDNISLSSTMSSASMVIRKLGSIGKLTRRNSLAGITSLFKDKKDDDEGGGKKSKKKKGGKGAVADPSLSHATAEFDRVDWSSNPDLAGLSPAARLARQHTLKTNAEAAAKAKAEQEARALALAAAAAQDAAVPATWEKSTTNRHGDSPSKSGTGRVNEAGMRVMVEDDSDSGSDSGHEPQGGTNYNPTDGWEDDEDWTEGQDDEEMTIRQGLENASLDDGDDMEPWAVNVRRSVEKARRPAKSILKTRSDGAGYEQDAFLQPNAPFTRVRSNSYDSAPSQSGELGPLAHIPSPDPDHIDGLHKHGPLSSNGRSSPNDGGFLPPLSFESNGLSVDSPKDSDSASVHSSIPEKSLFTHPNSSAPALSTMLTSTNPPTLSTRSATAPTKRLAFASNLSVYDTFPATVYDRRSEPATWSRLTPALAQRIKEELNSYKMEEMEVHAASRVHTQFFV